MHETQLTLSYSRSEDELPCVDPDTETPSAEKRHFEKTNADKNTANKEAGEGEEPLLVAEVYQSLRLYREPTGSIIASDRKSISAYAQSLNVYQGCQHACVYCYSRPSHPLFESDIESAFETQIIYQASSPEYLELLLQDPNYRCQTIVLGTCSDPYQPVELHKRITRQLLEVLWRYRHPVSIATKSDLILEDLDILSLMAEQNLVSVTISLATLDDHLQGVLEPEAASAGQRLNTIHALHELGVPVELHLSPLIPLLNDSEVESILEAAKDAGALCVSYSLLRLPFMVAEKFELCLREHFPEQADEVLEVLRQTRGGKLFDSPHSLGGSGQGQFALSCAQRFKQASLALNFEKVKLEELNVESFAIPVENNDQLFLF